MILQDVGSKKALILEEHEFNRLRAILWASEYSESKDHFQIGKENFISCRIDFISLTEGLKRN